MKERKLLFFLYVLGIVSITELSVIVTTVSPQAAETQGVTVFFACLLGALTSVLSLIWHPIRAAIHHNPTMSRWVSLRQSFLVSLLITLTLLFKSLGIMTIWDIFPLAISALLIEFFFQADKSAPTHEPV